MLKPFTLAALLFFPSAYASESQIHLLKLPVNFSIKIYASMKQIPVLDISNDNIVLVGSREEGRVYAFIPDKEKKTVLVTAEYLKIPINKALYHRNGFLMVLSQTLQFKNEPEKKAPARVAEKGKLRRIMSYFSHWIAHSSV